LDIDAEVGHTRAVAASGGKRDRMESQPMEFFQAVRQGYLNLAAAEPERFRLVDADQSIEKVSAEIWSVCESLLSK
ncbi:MAG: dTMP kinase, partial [Verrucomicrobiota bacterium]